jgi:serine/threonine protein kinase
MKVFSLGVRSILQCCADQGSFFTESAPCAFILVEQVRQIKNERDVLAKNLTSYMVRLMYSWQDRKNLYLAMEYCPGGDLRRLIAALGCLMEDESKLCALTLIAAVSGHPLTETSLQISLK